MMRTLHKSSKVSSKASSAPVPNLFQSRPFSPPNEVAPQQQETPELQKQQQQSKSLGFDFAKVSMTPRDSSNPPFLQRRRTIIQPQDKYEPGVEQETPQLVNRNHWLTQEQSVGHPSETGVFSQEKGIVQMSPQEGTVQRLCSECKAEQLREDEGVEQSIQRWGDPEQNMSSVDENMSSVDRDQSLPSTEASSDPRRLALLEQLLNQITSQTNESWQLRSQLNALPPQSSKERTQFEEDLNTSRASLIELIEQRIDLLNAEIASLNARIGSNPSSSPDHPETEELAYELIRREEELQQHRHQLQPLKRWQMRREIGSIDAQIAEINQELSTLPPVSDPANPTAELLLNRRAELEQRKQTLAQALTSTATEYEQWDSRWGAKRYGKSSECTTIKQAGCGPTSLAIVLNYLYQEDPESLASSGAIDIVTPEETATYAATNGRVCNSGTSGDTMVTNVETQWPGFRGRKINLSEATSQLRSGNLVIFLCKDCTGQNRSGGDKNYGGHFMVLNGVNETGAIYNVLDPGANESRDISTITRGELLNHATGFWIIQPK